MTLCKAIYFGKIVSRAKEKRVILTIVLFNYLQLGVSLHYDRIKWQIYTSYCTNVSIPFWSVLGVRNEK